MLAVVGGIVYAIYMKCIARRNNIADTRAPPPYSEHQDHSRPSDSGNPPPRSPYGFRDEYMPKNNRNLFNLNSIVISARFKRTFQCFFTFDEQMAVKDRQDGGVLNATCLA